MDIMRVQVQWSGFPGGPGYSAFHFAGGGGLITDAQQVADRVAAAFQLIKTHIPSTVTLRVESEVPVLDADTGMTTSFRNITPPAAIVGGNPGNYSAASGAVVNWRTDDLRGGRRIRGRTFLVPLASASYDTNGSLAGSVVTALGSFAAELVGGDMDSEFGVWSRPVGGSGGVFATATSYSVPDMAAVLRSRRD